MLKRLIALTTTLSLLLGPGGIPLSAAEQAASAATLDGIEVGPDQVTLHLSEQAKYNTFVTADPPRLVVELLNTEFQSGSKVQKGQGNFLKKVRAGQFQKEPTMISRIVLDLVRLVGYQAGWEGRSLVVRLQSAAADEAAAKAAVPAPVVKAEEGKAVPVVAAKPAAKPAETAKPAAKPAEAAKPVETAKPAAKPVEAPKVAAKPAEVPVPVAKPAAPKSIEAPKATAESAMPVPAAVPVKAAAPKVEKAAAKKAPELPKGFSPELGDMAATGVADKVRDGEGEAAESAAASSSGVGGGFDRRTRRDILGSLSNELISLDYEGTDVRDVIKLLASKARINIIYGPDVAGSLTLHLTDVPFSEAFMTILQMQGLVADQAGENILRIMTPTTLQKERTVAVNQTRIIRLKYSKAADIKGAIDAVRQAEGRAGKLNSDEATNSLIVTDTLDGIASVERLLSKLDVRPQQVMIEAKLVEVKLTKDLNFGIQWDYAGVDSGKFAGKQGQTTIGTLTNPNDATLAKPLDQNSSAALGVGAGGRGTGVFLPASKVFGALTVGRITNNYFLSATLTAAASAGKVKVLSDPKIATLNGKKASINITTNIPYATSNVASTGVTSQSVGNIVTGIQLDVTPTINADGRITIQIKPTVSQPSGTTASAVVGVPAVDTRTADTTVLVQDGETVVIGGLITDSVVNTVAKVPLLGDIPILGWLFKKKIVERSRVELLIFVTPHVMPS
ncbi:MAG: type IV pilus secretin PilQ [Elusimicrobiota bacterium]|jgi:type IV pilus assembly protein PilQ